MQNSFLNVPIPTNDFLEFVDFLWENDSPLDPILAIRKAIDYWIESSETRAEEDWLRILHITEQEEPKQPKSNGYLWKTVLLPPGTRVQLESGLAASLSRKAPGKKGERQKWHKTGPAHLKQATGLCWGLVHT